MSSPAKKSAVVLISGSGSNLQAFIDACREPDYPLTLSAVISNRPGAYGLERAREAGIDTACVDHTAYPDRESFDTALQQAIDTYQPDVVILAGFMRILTPEFVEHYLGRMLNIHPSLLPAYPGLHTHQQAIDDGVSEHGASVHFVTTELDGGPVVLQVRVPVLADDNADILAARVLEKEHIIYPLAVRWFAEGRLGYHDNRAWLDENVLERPCQLDNKGECHCDT